jgi:hypothetical protein
VAGLVVVALGTGGFVVATETVSAVGRVLIEPSSGPPPAEGGDWVMHRVDAGESLWSIAADSPAGGDIRPRVDELVRINGGSTVTAGQLIRIPADWVEEGR